MPFKKVGDNDYTSPSGRHFNSAQVRLYYAGGGKFPGEKKATGGPTMPLNTPLRRGPVTPAAGIPVRRGPPPGVPGRGPPPGGPPVGGLGGPPVPAVTPKLGAPMRASFAAGGPVLGRTRSFMKPDGKEDEFTGGRTPPKP